MSLLRIGSVELGPAPRVAVTVRNGVPRPEIEQVLDAGADFVELRIDLFKTQERTFVLNEARRYAGIPTIATIRCAAEGGGWNGPEEERLNLYLALLPHVDAVDVELSAHPLCGKVFAQARNEHRLGIGSYHNFDGTPSLPELNAIYAAGKHSGADIVKVAASCRTTDDVHTLAQFTLEHKDENVIVIGMGALGRLTRIFFPALGSRITFTFMEESAAPGQLNWRDTLKYLEAFFPNRRMKTSTK